MKKYKLEDICDIQIGKTPLRREKSYWGIGEPWLSISDMGDLKYVQETKEQITAKAIEECNCKVVPANTLLFSFKLSIGKVAITKIPMFTNEAIAALIIKDANQINQKFLYYILKYKDYTEGSNKAVMGKVLNKTKLMELEVLIPSLEDQNRIVKILDQANELRGKRKESIALLDELTRSIFLDMFGDPVTNPKGWEVKELEDVSNNLDSKRVPVKKSDRVKIAGEYPYYGATGIVDYINDYIFDGKFLLIAEDGKNLVNRKKDIAWVVEGKFWVNNHAHIVESNGKANLTFIAHHFKYISISKYVTGIDQFKMNKSNLNSIKICVPPVELQNEFEKSIDAILNQQKLLNDSLTYFNIQFNALMQKAFMGEL